MLYQSTSTVISEEDKKKKKASKKYWRSASLQTYIDRGGVSTRTYTLTHCSHFQVAAKSSVFTFNNLHSCLKTKSGGSGWRVNHDGVQNRLGENKSPKGAATWTKWSPVQNQTQLNNVKEESLYSCMYFVFYQQPCQYGLLEVTLQYLRKQTQCIDKTYEMLTFNCLSKNYV